MAAAVEELAKPIQNQRALARPLQIGLSVGHPFGTCGSIGPFVRGADGLVGFLSTATVLAPSGATPGDLIHQPAPPDTSLTGRTRAARLSKLIVQPDAQHTVDAVQDAAVAWLLEGVGSIGNVVPEGLPGAGLPLGAFADAPAPGDRVALSGRTTRYGEGSVTGFPTEPFRLRLSHGPVLVENCMAVEGLSGPFSAPGDAGALVWRMADGAALGLVFASGVRAEGASVQTYVLPLPPILERFRLALL